MLVPLVLCSRSLVNSPRSHRSLCPEAACLVPCLIASTLKTGRFVFQTHNFFLVFHLVIPIFHHQIVCWGKAQKQQQMSLGGLQNSPVKITLSIKEIISFKYHMPTSPQLQKSPAFGNGLKSSNHQLAILRL